MSKQAVEPIVYSKNVIEFVTVANEFCAFVDGHARFSRADFIDRLQKLFPLLYLKASLLPVIIGDNLESPEKFVTEIDYNFLLNKLSEKLGQFDSYQEVFLPEMQFSESAIEATISENICDVYQDLKDFLLAYRIGTNDIMTDAIWECQNNFTTYWGQKLVNGLRAIHALRYGDLDLNEDQLFANLERDEDDLDDSDDDNWVSKHFNNYSESEESTENEL